MVKGVCPIHIALAHQHIDVVEALLESKPNLYNNNFQDSGERTILHYAAYYLSEPLNLIDKLINMGVDLNKENKIGFLPIHYAAQEGHLDVFTILSRDNTYLLKKTKQKTTPLHLAIMANKSSIINHILTTYPNPKLLCEQKDFRGMLPLHYACFYYSDIEIVKRLIEIYPDAVNDKDEKGLTALHFACLGGQSAVANYLIESRALSLQLKDNKGLTPLHHACKQGQTALIEDLLTSEYITPNILQEKDNFGRTALFFAVESGYSMIVKAT